MSTKKKALLLAGSARHKNKSSSWLLGDFLLKSLSSNGFETNAFQLNFLINSKRWSEELISAINYYDILIFSSPVYTNSLPSFVIQVMEEIKENKKNITGNKKIFVISNCGFPEIEQNMSSINTYRQFAKEMDFTWLGAFGFSMGSLLSRWRFLNIFGIFHNIKKALFLAAAAIAQDETVPVIAQELAAKPIISVKLYTFLANLGFKKAIALNFFINSIRTTFYRKKNNSQYPISFKA